MFSPTLFVNLPEPDHACTYYNAKLVSAGRKGKMQGPCEELTCSMNLSKVNILLFPTIHALKNVKLAEL